MPALTLLAEFYNELELSLANLGSKEYERASSSDLLLLLEKLDQGIEWSNRLG
ncbi:hypothetical protein FRC09_011637, partial [Ceratobasidium sp. 395]